MAFLGMLQKNTGKATEETKPSNQNKKREIYARVDVRFKNFVTFAMEVTATRPEMPSPTGSNNATQRPRFRR